MKAGAKSSRTSAMPSRLEAEKVNKLAEIVTKQANERDKDREAEKKRTELERYIASVPTPFATEFWCDKCQKDFNRMAHKVVITAFGQPIAMYRAKCPKNLHWCTRRITDKIHDEYYRRSALVRRARVELERDLIQPGDPRFNRIYGDPLKKYYEEKEAEERLAWKKKKENP